MTSLPVLPSQQLQPAKGGSGYGISYYNRAALCTRAFHLDREMEAEGLELPMGDAAKKGTYFHSMAEAYYKGEDYVQEVSDVAGIISETTALWGLYTKRYPGRTWFGDVEGVEQPLEGSIPKQFVSATDLSIPISGRVDLVVRPTQESIARLEEAGVYGLSPGQLVLIDHKTQGQKKQHYLLKFTHSPQFILYNWLYEQQYGEKPNGTIVNIITTTKTPSFELLYIPPPTKEIVDGVLRWLSGVATRVAVDNTPNLAACTIYGMCPHRISGRCLGY